jgi:amino acid transporter
VLLFFAGLFVLVAALQRTGFPQTWVAQTEGALGHGALVLTAVLSLGSQSSTIYAVLIVVALTAVNIAGLKESARTQNLLSVLLVLGMLLVVAAGVIEPATGAAPPPAPAPGVPALFGTALLFVLFTFGGWNEAAYISAEVKGGSKSIVKVLVLALLAVTAIYLLFVTALYLGLGFDGLKGSKAVAADVAQKAFGTFGEKAIGAIVALAALTSINATMIVAARTNYSLGNDWPLFGFMSRWNSERDVPTIGFIVTGALALALVLLAAVNKSGIKFMVDFTAPVFWFFFLLTGIALFVLRFRYPQVVRPFKVPMYPLLPLAFVGTCGFLLYKSLEFTLQNKAIQIALYVMLAGVVVWIVARLRKR